MGGTKNLKSYSGEHDLRFFVPPKGHPAPLNDETSLSKNAITTQPRKVSYLVNDAIEIQIGGTEQEPETAYFPLIEEVVSQFPTLVREAESYLNAFVKARIVKGSSGKFYLWGLSCGTWKQATPEQFELVLQLHEDDLGWWMVRFHRHSSPVIPFWPCYFARKQD